MSDPFRKRRPYGCIITATAIGAGVAASLFYYGAQLIDRRAEEAPELARRAEYVRREAQIDSAMAGRRFDLAKQLVEICNEETCVPRNRQVEIAYKLNEALKQDSVRKVNEARAAEERQRQAEKTRQERLEKARTDSIARAETARIAAAKARSDSLRNVNKLRIEGELETAIQRSDFTTANIYLKTLIDSGWSPPGRTRQYQNRMARMRPAIVVDTTGEPASTPIPPSTTTASRSNSSAGLGQTMTQLNGAIAEYKPGNIVLAALTGFGQALARTHPDSRSNAVVKRICDPIRANIIAYDRAATTLPNDYRENALVTVNGTSDRAGAKEYDYERYLEERASAIPQGMRGRIIEMQGDNVYVFFPAKRDLDFNNPRDDFHRDLLRTRSGIAAYKRFEVDVINLLANAPTLQVIRETYANSRCNDVSPWRPQ